MAGNDGAAIVQADRSVLVEVAQLVEVAHPGYDTARSLLTGVAELEKSPEHVHTQQEALRLGRVLRPKPGGASFYSIVTIDTIVTCGQERALHRQRFLTEQGYRDFIEDFAEQDTNAQGISPDPKGKPHAIH